MAAWIEEKPESKWENPKTTLETKSEAYKTSIYDETEKHMLKNGKTDPKKISKIPMPPLWMNRSVQSRTHTNDNTTTIIITETSTKTLFIVIIFQSETCCKTTLVTRYFSGKVSCHAIESFVDCEHRCLTPRLQPQRFFFFL